jgi:hypothetical protein
MKKAAPYSGGGFHEQSVLAKGWARGQRGLMNSIESGKDDLAARVAWMHFLEKKTQHEIAAGLISLGLPSTVSSLMLPSAASLRFDLITLWRNVLSSRSDCVLALT